MRPLSSKPNVITPGGDYPYGRIKDKTSPTSSDGVPVNEAVYGDFHQFFERMMAVAGVVANGNPENNSYGFQLNEALEKMIGYRAYEDKGTPDLTVDTGTAVFHSTPYNRTNTRGKTIIWNFAGAITTTGTPNYIRVETPLSFTFPSTIFNASGITVIGSWNGVPVKVLLGTTYADIRKLDGSPFSAETAAATQFLIVFEIE